MSRIESWASRKPCIALMGEFSAGKTTLINFLLGDDVLPTRVTA
ncbi:MAG: dynamin family protein, partial [Rhodobacteraceae bacterium]|nr:dynamin family protein [Paracoccaceae bacterium]